jgi:hypothetical protein
MGRIGAYLLLLGLLAASLWAPPSVGRKTAAFARPAGDKSAPGKAGDKEGAKPEKQRKPRFTVGKETTYVLGPLTRDGYPDYVAALNQRLSKGVTVANNANVLFWKAFGPQPEGVKLPPAFFKWLGFRPLERGDYFILLPRYLKERFQLDPRKEEERFADQLERAGERPWAVPQYPHLASWLKANRNPLAVLIEGTRRPHYFAPLVTRGKGPVADVIFPGTTSCRQAGPALLARAMLRLGEERYADAWQDLLACHRLGRLLARGGTLIEYLVGISLDNAAGAAGLAYLDQGKLTARQLRACLSDLQRLPPMPPLADRVDLSVRFDFLDSAMLVIRDGMEALDRPWGMGMVREAPKPWDPKVKRFWESARWDVALRNGNRWCDRLVAALQVTDRVERTKRLDQIDVDMKELAGKLFERIRDRKAILAAKDPDQVKGEILGDLLIKQTFPAIARVQESADKAEQRHRNFQVAFALAAHRADHGRYPAKLEALAPKYLPRVPGDLFSGKPLIYRPSAKGYLLYSVGINGQDEQGRSEEDDPNCDDLAVRMPLPAVRRD